MSKKLQKILKQEILNHDIISFDIFDTLLIRPYAKPTDLFLHMEKYFDAAGFAENRINAELKAREKYHPDVTINQIYDEIDEKYKGFKQKELDWEKMVLRPNPQMVEIYNFAKQTGKRIIIASDMYLPTKFLEQILQKNGFDGYEKIYVSGDAEITKDNGTMYAEIIRATNVNPDEILHIGDNKHSDHTVPKSYNIKTFLIKKLFNQYAKNNPKIKQFLEMHQNQVGASILVSMLSFNYAKNTDNNYWSKLGYEYAGPTVYGYTKWVEKNVTEHNISNLFFVARDGYTMHKVFNLLNTDIKTHYVYAPRFMKQAVQSSKKTYENYKKYLNNLINEGDQIAMVDTISSGSLTSQSLLEDVLNKNILGFYWSIDHPNNNYQTKEFRPNTIEHHKVFTKNWNFMEFLMTAPESPIKGLNADGSPVYGTKISREEKLRCHIYPFVSDGAVDFTKDIVSIFGNLDVYFSDDIVIDWINCFCDFPTRTDVHHMRKLKHAYDAEHSKYIPLFCIDTFHFLLNPRKYQYVVWLSKFQRLVINLLTKR